MSTSFGKYLALAGIIILSFLPLLWFEPGQMISGFDQNWLGFDRIDYFTRSLYAWNDRYAFGVDNLNQLGPTLTFNLWWLISAGLGLSVIAAEKILFILLMAYVGLSSLYLVSWLVRKFQHRRVASFVGAVFGMVNFYLIVLWHNQLMLLVFAVASLSLLAGLLLRGLDSGKWKKYGVWLAIGSMTLSAFGMNPPAWMGMIVFPLSLIFIFGLGFNWRTKGFRSKAFKMMGVAIALGLFLNAWWLLPMVNFSLSSSVQPEFLTDLDQALARDSQHLSLINLSRLAGYWGLYIDDISGQPEFSFGHIYTGSFGWFVILGFIPPILALMAFFFRKKMGREWWVVIFLTGLSCLLFSQGLAWPFGSIYQFLTNHLPGFWIFRSPYYKFMPGLVMAIMGLMTVTLAGILDRFKNQPFFRIGIVILVGGAIVGYSFPMFNGQLMSPKVHQDPQISHIEETRTFLEQKLSEKTGKIFFLPEVSNPYVSYEWGYQGIDFVNNPLPFPGAGAKGGTIWAQEFINQIHQIVFRERSTNLGQILGAAGARYVIQRNDIVWETYPKHLMMSDEDKIKRYLSRQSGLSLVERFGPWDIYEINDDLVWPEMSLAESAIEIGPNSKTMIDWGRFADLGRIPFLVESQNLDLDPAPDQVQKFWLSSEEYISENTGWTVVPWQAPEGGVTVDPASRPVNKLVYDLNLGESGDYELWVSLDAVNDSQTKIKFFGGNQEVVISDQNFQGLEGENMILVKAGEMNFSEEENKLIIEVAGGRNSGVVNLQYLVLKSIQEGLPPAEMIEYEKINSGKYLVKMPAMEAVTRLSLLNSFHPQWKIYEVGQICDFEEIPPWAGWLVSPLADEHEVVNGFANSWIIQPGEERMFLIEFWPRRLIIIGGLISILTALSTGAILIYRRPRRS